MMTYRRDIEPSPGRIVYFKTDIGDVYVRLIRTKDLAVWNADTSEVDEASNVSWANSAMDVAYSSNVGGYPWEVPAALPGGIWDVVFYGQAGASAANTDEVVYDEVVWR